MVKKILIGNFKGPKGDTGPTGPTGPKGDKGSKGDTCLLYTSPSPRDA